MVRHHPPLAFLTLGYGLGPLTKWRLSARPTLLEMGLKCKPSKIEQLYIF
ncbi:hypothetical protein HHE02_17770 [Helicobacter heilmannii]|uniref:Uncharacterized protein n=1 Tax=Helicobacter heilmannii TaxID=35817 RepID=A0A0K2YA15_HELHE|nr:hypothetical protein HHE02_17770 [Helicobacter heilmannii]CRI34544.1 hypothetical protein HHE01_03450 [Helicobacter heilmannii]